MRLAIRTAPIAATRPPRGVSRTAGFVAGIRSRYGARGQAVSRPGMPLVSLRGRMERAGDAVSNQFTLVLRPRLELAISTQVRHEAATPAAPPRSVAPLRLTAGQGVVRQALGAARAITERLRLRETRIELPPSVHDPRPPREAGAPAPPLPPPSLPLAGRRPPEPATPEHPAPAPMAPAPAELRAAALRMLPPAEVARLTDEVMLTLNRRIAAHRERSGRR